MWKLIIRNSLLEDFTFFWGRWRIVTYALTSYGEIRSLPLLHYGICPCLMQSVPTPCSLASHPGIRRGHSCRGYLLVKCSVWADGTVDEVNSEIATSLGSFRGEHQGPPARERRIPSNCSSLHSYSIGTESEDSGARLPWVKSWLCCLWAA